MRRKKPSCFSDRQTGYKEDPAGGRLHHLFGARDFVAPPTGQEHIDRSHFRRRHVFHRSVHSFPPGAARPSSHSGRAHFPQPSRPPGQRQHPQTRICAPLFSPSGVPGLVRARGPRSEGCGVGLVPKPYLRRYYLSVPPGPALDQADTFDTNRRPGAPGSSRRETERFTTPATPAISLGLRNMGKNSAPSTQPFFPLRRTNPDGLCPVTT
jgi:hypothetical protein